MTGYSGTPLSKKLGLEEGQRIRFVGAPDHFRDLIGPLPPGSEMTDGLSGTLDLAVMFAGSQQVLENGLGEIAARLAPNGALWVAWPKKSSGVATDLDFEAVQRTGLDAGLVDNQGLCNRRDVVRPEVRLPRRGPAGNGRPTSSC